jgi:hypothetical protein
MIQSHLEPGLSRRAILDRVCRAEREAHDLLEQAVELCHDSADRALYRRLAENEEQALRELEREKAELEAEEFVQKAMDV